MQSWWFLLPPVTFPMSCSDISHCDLAATLTRHQSGVTLVSPSAAHKLWFTLQRCVSQRLLQGGVSLIIWRNNTAGSCFWDSLENKGGGILLFLLSCTNADHYTELMLKADHRYYLLNSFKSLWCISSQFCCCSLSIHSKHTAEVWIYHNKQENYFMLTSSALSLSASPSTCSLSHFAFWKQAWV